MTTATRRTRPAGWSVDPRPPLRTPVTGRFGLRSSRLPGPVVLGVADADLGVERPAMELAVREAEARGVPIVVLHACGTHQQPARPAAAAAQLWHGQRVVGLVAHRVRRLSRVQTMVRGLHSTLGPAAALLEASRSASMVVLQLRPDHEHLFGLPGSTVREVARAAACPVAVLHGTELDVARRGVVVGVQGPRRLQTCVRVAVEEALRRCVPLTAVHAWDVPDHLLAPFVGEDLRRTHEAAERVLGDALSGLSEAFPTVEVRRRVVRGPVPAVLRGCAQDAELLVVGRRSGSAVDLHALGRDAGALLHEAPCPVVLTPPYGPTHQDVDPRLADVLLGAGRES